MRTPPKESRSEYDFEAKYRPGTQMGDAEGLSRIDVAAITLDIPKRLLIAVQELSTWINDPRTQARKDVQKRDGLWEARVTVSGCEYVVPLIPETLREWLLINCHRSRWAGHPGAEATELTARKLGFWPGMERNIREFIDQCIQCQACIPGRLQAPIQRPFIPSAPGETVGVGVDHVGPLETRHGRKYLLTAVDHFTKYAEAYVVPDCTAETVARVMATRYIPTHGVPQRLVTDRGAAFTSRLVQDLCQTWGIQKIQASAYHPQGNGVCERFHRTFENILSKIVENTKDWEPHVPVALAAYRATPLKSTGYTPNFLTFGREIRLPNTLGWTPDQTRVIPIPLDKAMRAAKQCLHEAWTLQAERINRRRFPRRFLVGDMVYLKEMKAPATECREFWSPWSGPWRVLSHGTVTYQVVDVLVKRRQTVHVNRLKPAIIDEVPDDAVIPGEYMLKRMGNNPPTCLTTPPGYVAGDPPHQPPVCPSTSNAQDQAASTTRQESCLPFIKEEDVDLEMDQPIVELPAENHPTEPAPNQTSIAQSTRGSTAKRAKEDSLNRRGTEKYPLRVRPRLDNSRVVTEELIRRKSEHNEKQIGTLEEISLHQEDIEKLEHIQNWCRDLKILLLHNNLISKIENLGKLKKLEYINFSQNNIEKIENLEGCESLAKLDFTLNFIGELTSVDSLKGNINLRELWLTGNPCRDFEGYRAYVVATLPQLQQLDGEEVVVSERILALRNYGEIRAEIIRQQNAYQVFRNKQKAKNQWKVDKWKEENIICAKYPFADPEDSAEYWNSKSDHSPETRFDLALRHRLSQDTRPGCDFRGDEIKLKPPVKLFSADGRPLNVNQAKIPFNLSECFEENCYKLDVAVYKHLDSALLTADVQPFHVTVTIKKKVFQLTLMEEVNPDASFAQRSQTTGHLLVTMPWVREIYKPRKKSLDTMKSIEPNEKKHSQPKREYLEVSGEFDLRKMLTVDPYERKLKEKLLVDDPEVPPLI